ncbi:hypothetical protein A6E15_17870 [Natrinema saccharevitans]|uniref:Uncharacterized protein n=1 Tax=Natrinema saccharevitans TaxID=301967 RepID=A0A1S8ART7_9EURY|nr:hypothetical protein A6E15_17870 [Natrinema saccharevitans]
MLIGIGECNPYPRTSIAYIATFENAVCFFNQVLHYPESDSAKMIQLTFSFSSQDIKFIFRYAFSIIFYE